MKRYVQIYEYLYNDHTEKSLLGILQEILDWFLEGRNKPQFKKEKKKKSHGSINELLVSYYYLD